MADTPADPALEFGTRLNEHVSSNALAETIMLGLYAMKADIHSGDMVADWPTRHKFAALAVQYKVGKPLERKEDAGKAMGRTLDEMIEHARASPEYRASITETLKAILEIKD